MFKTPLGSGAIEACPSDLIPPAPPSPRLRSGKMRCKPRFALRALRNTARLRLVLANLTYQQASLLEDLRKRQVERDEGYEKVSQ
jgi:hypothetical protein